MYANDAYGMVFYNVLDATESGLVTLQAQPYSTSGERLEAQLVKVGPEGGRHHVKVGPEGGVRHHVISWYEGAARQGWS